MPPVPVFVAFVFTGAKLVVLLVMDKCLSVIRRKGQKRARRRSAEGWFRGWKWVEDGCLAVGYGRVFMRSLANVLRLEIVGGRVFFAKWTEKGKERFENGA